MSAQRARRLRWLAPVAIIAGVASVSILPNLLPAGAESVPVLPDLTPAQLLDKVRTASVTTFSGDLSFTARLGLPDLTGLGGLAAGVVPADVVGLLSGTHTAHIWLSDPEHVRLALDAAQNESDWIRNGSDVWAWDSATQQVRHATVALDVADAADGGASPGGHDEADAPTPALDPQSMANELLAKIDLTTAVSLRTPGYVAGRPVYELVVSPRSANSTISAGVISVDAASGMPLAVRIEARGTSTPALEMAFTKISFNQPAASKFAFTPPPGSTVTQVAVPADLLPFGGGRDGGQHDHQGRNRPNRDGALGATPSSTPESAAQSGSQTIGTGWDTVEIFNGANVGGQFGSLLDNAPQVTLASGVAARLISTRLLNALVLSDGRIALGAVTPAALQAAVSGK